MLKLDLKYPPQLPSDISHLSALNAARGILHIIGHMWLVRRPSEALIENTITLLEHLNEKIGGDEATFTDVLASALAHNFDPKLAPFLQLAVVEYSMILHGVADPANFDALPIRYPELYRMPGMFELHKAIKKVCFNEKPS